MTAVCHFCLRSDRPMTREHVFPQWLVRRVRGARIVASRATGAEGPPRVARLTATVCAPCNTGWMSTLEVSFRSAFFARPRTGELRAPDRVTLSRWFTKTATLLADAHRAMLVDAPQRTALMHGMPDDIEVFLARRRRPPQRLDFALQLVPDTKTAVLAARSVAVLIDDVVAHVAPRGALASRHGTRLWPLRSHLLRWDTLPVIKAAALGKS
jgi:hypothetical protein